MIFLRKTHVALAFLASVSAFATEPCLKNLYEIIAEPYPGIETIRTERINASRPEEGRKRTVRIPPIPNYKEALVWGSLIEAVERHPSFAKKYGYELDRTAGTLTYLDADAQNAVIHRLQAAGDPDAPAIEFWNFHGKEEASHIEFAEHWIKGQAPIARYGKYHHHDIGVHSIGYLLLPSEVVAASRARFSAFQALIRDPALQRFHPIFEEMILANIDRLDTATANLGSHFSEPLSESTYFNVEGALGHISQGTKFILRSRSEFSDMTPSERNAMERAVATHAHPGLSNKRIEELSKSLVDHHWKPAL